MSVEKIELTEVIRQLRAELVEAMEAGRGEELQFAVKDLELELQVGVTKEAGGEVGGETKLGFWIFSGTASAKATASLARERVQTLRLRLEPEKLGNDGKPRNVKLSGRRKRDR